jgi:prepilin-type N-terminal cleavage/methylation domain-containing protein
MRLKSGFTLVELAIVLVIIGLLVGGVLQGQALIEQAQIRAVIAQLREYDTAVNTFRAKYDNSLPGDIENAHAFGLDKNQSGDLNVARTDCPNFDGNGDGPLSIASSCDSSSGSIDLLGEALNFWVHLSNIGLIKGNFSQPYNCYTGSCGYKSVINLPSPAIGSTIVALTNYGDSKLYYTLGKDLTAEGGDLSTGLTPSLTPEQAYSLDSKLDDGIADKGGVQSFYGYFDAINNLQAYFVNYTSQGQVIDSTTCYNSLGNYNLSLKSKLCQIRIRASS